MKTKRAGRTVKVSISLDRRDLAALKRQARALHQGNLSAAFAEAARLLRQREARTRLVDRLGGPSLTADAALAIEAELAGGPRYAPKRAKRTPPA